VSFTAQPSVDLDRMYNVIAYMIPMKNGQYDSDVPARFGAVVNIVVNDYSEYMVSGLFVRALHDTNMLLQ
jgi:hypothetical protein